MTPAAQTKQDEAIEKRVNIVQGEQSVSSDPTVVISTLLGSCVAACIRDPVAGVGGVNHFLLPGGRGGIQSGDAMRHGVHAMELLVNALLRQGARRDRLEAKLFGGANLMNGLTDIGSLNALFAEAFLEREGIAHVGGSLRGGRGRRIQFWPVSGRARQVLMAPHEHRAFDGERKPQLRAADVSGGLELF
jgi:chemotaxis protein CheD